MYKGQGYIMVTETCNLQRSRLYYGHRNMLCTKVKVVLWSQEHVMYKGQGYIMVTGTCNVQRSRLYHGHRNM